MAIKQITTLENNQTAKKEDKTVVKHQLLCNTFLPDKHARGLELKYLLILMSQEICFEGRWEITRSITHSC